MSENENENAKTGVRDHVIATNLNTVIASDTTMTGTTAGKVKKVAQAHMKKKHVSIDISTRNTRRNAAATTTARNGKECRQITDQKLQRKDIERKSEKRRNEERKTPLKENPKKTTMKNMFTKRERKLKWKPTLKKLAAAIKTVRK